TGRDEHRAADDSRRRDDGQPVGDPDDEGPPRAGSLQGVGDRASHITPRWRRLTRLAMIAPVRAADSRARPLRGAPPPGLGLGVLESALELVRLVIPP